MHLAILPFLHAAGIDLEYTLALQDKRFDRDHDLFIECSESGKKISISDPVVRKQGEGNTIRSTYYQTGSFDAIRTGSDRPSDLSCR